MFREIQPIQMTINVMVMKVGYNNFFLVVQEWISAQNLMSPQNLRPLLEALRI